MFGIKGGAIRTNLAILAVGAGQTLGGVVFVVYGPERALDRIPLSLTWYWTAFVIAMGLGGVLLIISKGFMRRRWLRLGLGSFSVLLMLLGVFTAYVHQAAAGFAYALLAAPAMLYALYVDEPEPAEASRSLLVLFAGALLVLQPLPFLFLKGGEAPAVPLPFMCALSAIGAYALWAHATRLGTTHDRTARRAVAAAFAVLAVGAFLQDAPVTALTYAPTAIILAFLPAFSHYRLGQRDALESLSDEAAVVRQFDALAELLAWSTFVFAYVHMLYDPGIISIRHVLFLLFVGAFIAFSLQYRLYTPARLNFRRLYLSSMVNAVLLAVICHFTGGITSPYNWFFVFILMSGSIAPHPKLILNRLAVILGYYAFETIYFSVNGFMTREIVVNQLMLESFILGLTGMYAYHLSVRRRKIDEDLLSSNRKIAEALEREKAAKTLVEKQSVDIMLAKKGDEALLAALADAVIPLDTQGKIKSLNPAAEGLVGHASAEAVGRRLRDLMPLKREGDPEFRLGEYVETALNGNAIPLPDDLYVAREDGRKLYLTGMVLPVFDERRRPVGVVVTLSDVTYMREVDQMKTGFLSVAAHQLRTPLSTIRWYLELLNDPSEGKLKKNQKMFAENAYLSLRKMVGLVNRLLAVTRLESGRVPIKPEPTDLKTLTKDILEALKPKLAERKLEIRMDIPDLPPVSLDQTLAREVFMNLIENAVRYTPDGGRIAIAARDEGDQLSWTVTDTGIGIPIAQQEKIFEKFFRAGNAVEYTSEGSGLGLYLAKFIVDAWGGKIGFVSGEGKGTEFRVTVPKAGMKPRAGQVSLNA